MESIDQSLPYNVKIDIPFPTKRHAEIAYEVLRIDEEPKRGGVTKELKLNDNILSVSFSAELSKNIRVSVTNFFELLILCTETMHKFGPPASQYDYAQ